MSDLENAEVFRTVLESLKMGICAVDRDRKIAFWNDGAGEITGFLRQEVLGPSCGEDPSHRQISLSVQHAAKNAAN